MSPSLHLVQERIDEIDRAHLDVHTVVLSINGQHGGWDVHIESTDEQMNDVRHHYVLDFHGYNIEAKEGALT